MGSTSTHEKTKSGKHIRFKEFDPHAYLQIVDVGESEEASEHHESDKTCKVTLSGNEDRMGEATLTKAQ
eukprot:2879190-Amphidinium_carterae.1